MVVIVSLMLLIKIVKPIRNDSVFKTTMNGYLLSKLMSSLRGNVMRGQGSHTRVAVRPGDK